MRDGKFLVSLSAVLLAAACGPTATSGGDSGGGAGVAGGGAPAAGAPAAGAPAGGAYTAGSSGSSVAGAPQAGSPAGGTGGTAGAVNVAGAAGSASTGTALMPPMMPTPVGDQSLPRKLYIENRCDYAIWNFALPKNTFPNSVPYKMEAHTAIVVGWPDKWSGRTWPRTACTGNGDNLKCAQTGRDTLVEFTLTAA